jgi:GT2 family glycosyltransferase
MTSISPSISVVILNYNGAKWLEPCLTSLEKQTIFSEIEIIIADNLSTDGSDKLAEKLAANLANTRFIQHGANLGYCEGNNRAADAAKGDYLFSLNNDTWLEPDCLEKLLVAVKKLGAAAASPLVMNYDDDSIQSLGAAGVDCFGLATSRHFKPETREIFMPEGCSYLIQRDVFNQLGKFDSVLFMYADELDLSWRLWNSGHRAFIVAESRLHHRGAAQVNPHGGGQVVEFRTSDTKRFYANRNCLLVLLKNAQHILFIAAFLQILLLCAEALAGLLLTRRWSFIRKAYLNALADCWRLRGHIFAERKRINSQRKRSDFWMLRFLRLRPNRWDEILRMRQMGIPKVTAR